MTILFSLLNSDIFRAYIPHIGSAILNFKNPWADSDSATSKTWRAVNSRYVSWIIFFGLIVEDQVCYIVIVISEVYEFFSLKNNASNVKISFTFILCRIRQYFFYLWILKFFRLNPPYWICHLEFWKLVTRFEFEGKQHMKQRTKLMIPELLLFMITKKLIILSVYRPPYWIRHYWECRVR